MTKNYTTRQFFRQLPPALLARYFQSKGVDHGLDIAQIKEGKPEPWLNVWDTLSDTARAAMEADFREIHGLGTEAGGVAMYDELQWQMSQEPGKAKQAVAALSKMANHHERAMLVFLDYPMCWRGATRFWHADTVSGTWRKRKGFTGQDAAVDDASLKRLADLISNYFRKMEGRGKHCVVEPYRRGEKDYFFAYPEDHSQRASEWVKGELAPRPHHPAFEIVFVYSKADGTLDIHYRGQNKVVEAMQGIFGQAILNLAELPPDPKDDRVYDLTPLAQRSFEFVRDAGSAIERVVVSKLRLSSRTRVGDRMTLEADATDDPNAVYRLLDQLRPTLPDGLWHVTQVELKADVRTHPDKRPKIVTIRITHPNSCSLKYDDLDLTLREMLEKSGIEPKKPQGPEVG